MRRLSSRWTGPFRIFLLRCAVWAPGDHSRHYSASPGSGATPRICGDGSGVSPGDSGFSPNPLGMTNVVQTPPRVLGTPARRCGCWTAAIPKQGRVSGSGPAVLWGADGQLPGWNVPPSACNGLWWTNGFICRRAGPDRCAAAGVPEESRNYRSKTKLALEMLAGPWSASENRRCGMRSFREGALRYVLDVPGGTTVWPGASLDQARSIRQIGRPRKPTAPWWSASELCQEAWREITVAEGSEGSPQLPVAQSTS